ncbi:protein involved in gliding motility SprE [Salegentibacter salegens]|uniref:Protein involved in gliding motility SprE n=1 Tax=Salegentibacter salegens TaxID=143223 RepID=A0A1M7MH90_9FLAO|nr:outer membrane protein assembly factor BamD (BamD/ComL family) [Salegentibacter salegens]SHM90260.1 protein involved in gliding motility SprE [Salegentibacter salegens]
MLLFGSIAGCSRKKNTFVNRNWHAVTTEYNTLYNGNLGLEQGKEELNQNYADNYWDILPIERMQIDENIVLPDSIRNQNFGYAEEKAVKAIQRHSMLIDGKERNPQIDEAYLLLGKARYFDQRFIPALEAFNYILRRYPASNNIIHARVWREKTHMRLDNNRLAVNNLKKVLDLEHLEEQDIADASATMAQAYINLRHLDSAVVPLKNAAEFTGNNEEKGRYFYILGQLNNELGQVAEANAAFDKVIDLNRKSPRIYMINAYVQKARNFEMGQGNNYELREMLRELEEDRENRPFLDKIYFQIGEYYNRLDSIDPAVDYYKKSLEEPASDVYLRSINYEILANINFDQSNYVLASKYFDSTLAEMDPQLREFRTIKKKRDNLEDVIKYEDVAYKNDSILQISQMMPAEQLDYFKNYTTDLRTKLEADNNAVAMPVNLPAIASRQPPASARTFYFYSEARVQQGRQEFLNQWGDRPLADNWRWAEVSFETEDSSGNEEAGLSQQLLDNDPRLDPYTYIDQIPTDLAVLDTITRDRDFAYYQLGIIYKENFREYKMAQDRLEAVLEMSLDERLILPSMYNLYQIYKITNQSFRAEEMKQEILESYPDSRYAAYILNPESIREDQNSPEAIYAELYRDFEAQNFNQVIAETSRYSSEFAGDAIVPKLELLKAQASGRLLGLEAYKSALNHVALTYPQTEEGKKAQQILNKTIPQLSGLEFNTDSLQQNYKLLYRFEVSEQEAALALKEKIETAISDINYNHLSVSIDVYDPEEVFVMVHGLENLNRAGGFAELLQINEDYLVEKEPIEISTENYRIVQIQKNLEEYPQPIN